MTTPHWKITYMNRLTGEKCTYMNMGFRSPERAQDEIRCILKSRKLYSDKELESWLNSSDRKPSYIVGTDWKVEPIKFAK